MQTLKVDLGERSYPIYIGEGLLDQAELLAPHIRGRQVAIVSNETVAPLYLERLSKTLGAYAVLPVILPDGEAHKNWETLQLIFDGLLTARHDRRTTVVALGGGVIGDMAGFAAACYQRGVDFIQVPTTLLSQVDSSVGGKTGINHPLGKNMVGAFYQPNAVLCDLATLRYTKGIDSYLGVLDAQRSYFAAQQVLVALRLANLSSQVRLYTVLGGGAE